MTALAITHLAFKDAGFPALVPAECGIALRT